MYTWSPVNSPGTWATIITQLDGSWAGRMALGLFGSNSLKGIVCTPVSCPYEIGPNTV